jgi:predicted HTH domain antitoxin
MTFDLPDEILQQAGLATERDVRIELACRLFDADKLPKWPACQLCGLTRPEFEAELHKRGLAVVHITEEYMRQELESLRRLDEAQRREAS